MTSIIKMSVNMIHSFWLRSRRHVCRREFPIGTASVRLLRVGPKGPVCANSCTVEASRGVPDHERLPESVDAPVD